MLLFAAFGLANAWPYAQVLRDVNGVAILIGSTVALRGVVTAINLNTGGSTPNGTVTFSLNNPIPGVNSVQHGNLQLVVNG